MKLLSKIAEVKIELGRKKTNVLLEAESHDHLRAVLPTDICLTHYHLITRT